MKPAFLLAFTLLTAAGASAALQQNAFHLQDDFPAPPIDDMQHDHTVFEGRQITSFETNPSIRFVGIVNRWSAPEQLEHLCQKHGVEPREVIFSVHESLYVSFESSDPDANLAFRSEAFKLGFLKGCFETSDKEAYQLAKRIDRREQPHQIIEISALDYDGLIGAIVLDLVRSEPIHRVFLYADLGEDWLTQNEQDIILGLGARNDVFLGVSSFDNSEHNPVFNAVSAILEGGPSSLAKLSAAILQNSERAPSDADLLSQAAAYCVETDDTVIVTKLGYLPADFSEDSAVRSNDLPASIRLNENRQIVGFDETGKQTHLINGVIPEAYTPWRYFDIDRDGRNELVMLRGRSILFANFDSDDLLSIQHLTSKENNQLISFELPPSLEPLGLSAAKTTRLSASYASLYCSSTEEPTLAAMYRLSHDGISRIPVWLEFAPAMVLSESIIQAGEPLEGEPEEVPDFIPVPRPVYMGDENGTQIWIYAVETEQKAPIPGLWKAGADPHLEHLVGDLWKPRLHNNVKRVDPDPLSSYKGSDVVTFAN